MSSFSIFADAYLLKSGNKVTPYRVGGIMTTEDRDADQEIVKAVDLSYFTGGFGKIKYEHREYKGPDAIIGFPLKIFRKGKELHFEGELIPFDPDVPDEKLSQQQRLAKSTVALLQHMEEHNKRHPENLQKAGWSVEGEYMSKDKSTGIVKARVNDVVFTTKPKNKQTFAQLIKSLEVGYSHGVTDQGGFGATRKSSLEGDTKFLTNNLNNSKGFNNMKSKEEIYKSCREKGMDHESALKEAEEWEKKHKGELEESGETAKKSLNDSKVALEKSIASAKEVETIVVEFGVDEHKRKLAKSVKTEGDEVDVTAYLQESQNVQLRILSALELMDKKVNTLAKSISTFAEGNISLLDNQKYNSEMVTEAVENVESLRKGLVLLTKSLAKTKPVSTEGLINIHYEENNEKQIEGELSKSKKLEVIDKLIEEGKISDRVATQFESFGSVPAEVEPLIKSKAAEMFK